MKLTKELPFFLVGGVVKPNLSLLAERIALVMIWSMALWGGAVLADGPRVDIQSPRDGDTFTAPAAIQICADAREWGGNNR